jgi:hypothetical protein
VVVLCSSSWRTPGIAVAGAGSGGRADLSISSRTGSVGRGIIDATPSADQLGERSIQPDRGSRFDVELRNVGDAAGPFTVTGSGGADGFTVRYFDQDGVDVTSAVTTGSFVVELELRGRSSLQVRIGAPAAGTVDTGARHTVWLRASGSVADGSDLIRGRVEVPPIRIWGSSFDGQLRCSVEFPHRIWRAGQRTNVDVRLTNLTDQRITLTRPTAILTFRDEHGDKVGDTVPPPFPGPHPGYIELGPGRSAQIDVSMTRVRWSGPLSVSVHCGAGRYALPESTIHMSVTEPQPSVQAAIDSAVAVPGSPWRACPPGADGEPAFGMLETPDGRDLPPLTLRCWATVREEAGFHVVSLHLVSPGDAPAYELGDNDPIRIRPEPADDAANFLAVRWSFVVTAANRVPYATTIQVQALGNGTAYGYTLREDGTWVGGGRGTCGFYGYGWSPTGRGLWLEWITGCTQTAASGREPRRPVAVVEDGHGLHRLIEPAARRSVDRR